MQVKADTSLHPADAVYGMPEYAGQGRPRKPGYQTPPVRAQILAQSLPIQQYQPASWRRGSKGMLTSRFAAVRVRPANRNIPRHPDGTLPAVWLLIEWPSNATAIAANYPRYPMSRTEVPDPQNISTKYPRASFWVVVLGYRD